MKGRVVKLKKNILILGLVAGMLMLSVPGFAQTLFADIKGHWAVQDIDSAFQKGIMKDIANDKFASNKAVTRAEVAVCVDRLFDLNYDDLEFIKGPSPDHQLYV